MADVSRNLILSTLSPTTLASLEAREERRGLTDIMTRADEKDAPVFFPHVGAAVSIVRATEDGWQIESGIVGSEGLVNLQSVLTEPAAPGVQTVVQGEGIFTRVEADRVRSLFQSDQKFRDNVLAFATTFLAQLTQNLVCNRLHPIEQRLSKWLLIMSDRTDSSELHLTQEFLAQMLGVHRPGVSLAVSAIENVGLITHTRNRIVIRDRDALLVHSCECARSIHTSLQSLRDSFSA